MVQTSAPVSLCLSFLMLLTLFYLEHFLGFCPVLFQVFILIFFGGRRLHLKFVLYIKFCYDGLLGWHRLFFLLLFPCFYVSVVLLILLDWFLANLYFNLFNRALPTLLLIQDLFLFLKRLRSNCCSIYEELLKSFSAY